MYTQNLVVQNVSGEVNSFFQSNPGRNEGFNYWIWRFCFNLKMKGSQKSIEKEIPSSTAAPGTVDKIIKALSGLETDIDSQNENLSDMKKQLNQKAQKEIDQLREQVIQMATKEAEAIISSSVASSDFNNDLATLRYSSPPIIVEILTKGSSYLSIKAQYIPFNSIIYPLFCS